MSLQNIFYLVGIICMTLCTLLLAVMVILLFYIKKKITEITKTTEVKINEIKEIITHPKQTVKNIGATIASTVLEQASKFLRSRKGS